MNDLYYRKCGLIMHMIESNIDETNLDKIFREMYADAINEKDKKLSQFAFRKKFKKICGMHPQSFYKNWILATSCPKLELSYEFGKRNNSLDLTLKQTSAVKDHYKIKKNLENRMSKIFGLSGRKLKTELLAEDHAGIDTFFVDSSNFSRRWFIGDINVVIYQVEGNGGDILKQQHKMSLKDFKTTVSAHIPLQGRVKRTMQTKKKEFDPYMSSYHHSAGGPGDHLVKVMGEDSGKTALSQSRLGGLGVGPGAQATQAA